MSGLVITLLILGVMPCSAYVLTRPCVERHWPRWFRDMVSRSW